MNEVTSKTTPLRAIVVAGTHSGVGKTSVTLGLIGALRRRGLTVQPFKVGPDFIDPLHHRHASGRTSRNLDGWMLSGEANRKCFSRATVDADVAVIEGVMGLFDGGDGKSERGSTAEMAKLLGLGVVLVVDANAMARSAAALIHGFTSYDPGLKVAGVILNNVGGPAHAHIIRDAVDGTVPILGAIPHDLAVALPERHLGLFRPHEAQANYFDRLATLVDEYVDVDGLLAQSAVSRPSPTSLRAQPSDGVRIGIARDEAFCFYYAENLELLEFAGAELVEFSPIADALPSDLDGLYLGGGYPELHARELSENATTMNAIREFAAAGGPVYAECGGLMYLARNLQYDTATYPMCGVLGFETRMPAPLKIAYVEVTTTGGLFGDGHTVRGHLFHQSEIAGKVEPSMCYDVETSRGEHFAEGYAEGNVLASYTHLHFGSHPQVASSFVDRCKAFHNSRYTVRSASTVPIG